MTDLLVITGLPTPYREPVFAEIASRISFQVAYVTQESERVWAWWRYLDGHQSSFLSATQPRTVRDWVRASLRLKGLLDEVRPRVVVAGGWDLPTYWAALAYARRHRVPFGFWVESTAVDDRPQWIGRELPKRFLLRVADGALVPGIRSHEYATSLGARYVEVAPNAVNNRIFENDGPVATSRTARVLYLGRLAPEKGLDVLADAAGLLSRKLDFELMLVGAGPMRSAIEAHLLRNGVKASFPGPFQDPESVATALHESDVLVLPSHSEQWGLVVNEAMAAGVPAVVSDAVGSGPNLIQPGVTGEIFPKGDATALASALETVLRRGRTPDVVAACRQVADNHSPARCADGFVRFVDHVVAGGRQP